jgi:hypothetical protein
LRDRVTVKGAPNDGSSCSISHTYYYYYYPACSGHGLVYGWGSGSHFPTFGRHSKGEFRKPRTPRRHSDSDLERNSLKNRLGLRKKGIPSGTGTPQ